MPSRLGVCVRLEVALARAQTAIPGWRTAPKFSFNPKAGGLHVAEAVVEVFPAAKHAFMYRACHKVAESFGGLLFADVSALKRLFMTVTWAVLGPRASPVNLVEAPPQLSELSSLPACMLTTMWLGTVSSYPTQQCAHSQRYHRF